MERKSAIELYKNLSSFIFEISRDEVITDVWTNNPAEEQQYRDRFIGVKISDIRNDAIIHQSSASIQKTFKTGVHGLIEYTTIHNGVPLKILTRTIPAPYHSDYVLSLVENIHHEDYVATIEDKWKIALEASEESIWDANLKTGKIFFSPRWQEIFGYEEGEISDYHLWSEKVHPNDISVARNAFDEYLQGLRPKYTAELRYLCKDGNYKWILTSGVIAAYDNEGKPYRFVGTHKDIQKRKLQEAKIEESEKKYKILFSYSEAMICTHDLEGHILTINPFVSKALGYNPDELIGKRLPDLIPAEYRSNFENEYLVNVKHHGHAGGIMHILNRDKEVKILLYKNFLFNNTDGQPYVIGFAQDITQRVAIEDALKESVDTFQSAFKYSGIGMALVSPRGRWMEVNDAICAITGYSKSELLELTFQDITHPDDLKKDLSLIRKILNKKIETYTLEKRYLSKSGDIIWVSLTTSPVWNTDNTIKFFIAQVVDITARKKLTTELHNKNIELEIAKTGLINKVSQLEELSYIVAHNLRGPTRNVNMLLEVLKIKNGQSSDNEQANLLQDSLSETEAISMASEACIALTDNLESLLRLAQIRLNKNIPFDNCDIEKIVAQVSSQLAADITRSEVEITCDLKLKEISYPKAYLESILYNLVSNAIKYRNPVVKPVITIATSRLGEKNILSVTDNGLGIDLEKHGDRVFKLNQVFHHHEDSKGIGLYMIKTQIESLGGNIALKSKVNEGSTFIITF